MLILLQTMEQGTQDKQLLEQLLAAVAAGSRDGLAQLYAQMRTAVYALALSYLKNPQDAQDLTQDVFVRLWSCAGQYRPQGKPLAWVLAICRNEALMRLRRDGRQTAQDIAWDAIPASAGLSPEERVLLQEALARLDERERRIVLLHAVTGLKHREIAGLLQTPLATVLSKYHRALKKLKAYLEGADAQ